MSGDADVFALSDFGPRSRPRVDVLGVPLDALTMDDTVCWCLDRISANDHVSIGVVNAAKLVAMRRDRSLYEAVANADVVVADGMAVVWASRILGQPLPERVAGIDLFTRLLAEASQRGLRVYLLGARADVLDEVCAVVRRDYPGANLVGHHDGYFTDEEAATVAAEVGASRPDLLFVAMTSPRKEIFLDRWQHVMNVKVCHGVGGSFDVLAGRTKRAPARWQRLGLEWLYRLLQEPRRMARRYLVTNAAFLRMVLVAIILQRGHVRR